MKFRVLFCFLVAFSFSVNAEDIISLRNGDIIKVIVNEITQTEIKYRKASNPNGPMYTIDKNDVLSILYNNGEKENFIESHQNKDDNNSSISYIAPTPDTDNADLIEYPNIICTNQFKPKGSKAKYGVPIMWMSENSIISTKDLSMKIVGIFTGTKVRYYLELTNKSGRNIYIDKSSSFRVSSEGIASSFYDNRIISTSENKSFGGSVGLGSITNALGIGGPIGTIANGIAVGGGSSRGTSTTYSDEQVIIIPPKGKKILNEISMHSDAESYMFDVKTIGLKEGEFREYTEETSPYSISYQIVYSLSPDFKTYSALYPRLYAKYIIGKSVRASLMKSYPGHHEWFENEKDMFKAYGKIVPDIRNLFGRIIIGRDYKLE